MAGAGERIVVTTFEEASTELTEMHGRMAIVEKTTDTIEKIYRFLKYATPVMIGALLAGVNHDSILYRVGSFLVDAAK